MKALRTYGHTRLMGTVHIGGSQSSSLALLAAAAAAEDTVVLCGLPAVHSVTTQLQVLRRFGYTTEMQQGSWHIRPSSSRPIFSDKDNLPWSAMMLMGPLISRWGQVSWPLPGGGPTGPRPLDLHIKALRMLGAQVEITGGCLHVDAKQLEGAQIALDVPSFGATWTALTAALRARGRSQIIGCSRAPEILDAVTLLNNMGARISGAGTEVITVHGETELSGGAHEVMPDRIAAGLYLLAAAGIGGEVEVTGVISNHLRSVIAKLDEAGVKVTQKEDQVRVKATDALRPLTLRTGFYPGFPSHLQPSMCSVLLKAAGTSIVTENLYDDRLLHLDQLQRLGGQVTRDGQLAVIRGGHPLSGTRVRAGEPGAAAALVIAGLMAKGESVIENAGLLLEWIEDPVGQLQALGATVEWDDSIPTAI